jgi:hypothetical protein
VQNEQWHRRLAEHPRSDRSSADFGLAIYLLKRGWHPADVRDALLRVSEDVAARKGRNLDFYLVHAVEKAAASAGVRMRVGEL